MSYSEAQRLRMSDADTIAEQSRAMHQADGGAVSVMAATTTITTYPVSASAFYGLVPLTVLGTETEGSGGSLTGSGATFLGLNLGSTIPPVGANVLVTFVGNRWVFRYDS